MPSKLQVPKMLHGSGNASQDLKLINSTGYRARSLRVIGYLRGDSKLVPQVHGGFQLVIRNVHSVTTDDCRSSPMQDRDRGTCPGR